MASSPEIAWVRMPSGRYKEHFLLSNVLGLAHPSGPALQVNYREKADVHVVYTPRDNAISDVVRETFIKMKSPNVSFSVFIDSTPQAIAKFGDPQFAVTYSDGSHFSKV